MSTDDKPKGPASYFPSIETKYGRTIDEWRALIDGAGIAGHMDLVTWLKETHGMGHGHANALAADRKARLADGA